MFRPRIGSLSVASAIAAMLGMPGMYDIPTGRPSKGPTRDRGNGQFVHGRPTSTHWKNRMNSARERNRRVRQMHFGKCIDPVACRNYWAIPPVKV